MAIWHRVSPMQVSPNSSHIETWISKESVEDEGRCYKVAITLGKPIDILSLKTTVVKDFAAQVEYHRKTRTALFKSRELEEVNACPVCGASAVNSEFRVSIYGGRYHQCSDCGHCFIVARLSESALKAFYAEDPHYSSTYVDKQSLETRVRQVAAPKAKWVIEQFKMVYGRNPTSILDIGAGGGHFVQALRQLGFDAKGIEVSELNREFCRTNFGFELDAVDFFQEWKAFSNFDVITFWGLIEHIPNPVGILTAAYKALCDRQTLVVACVPHWDSFSTAVQTVPESGIVRHLDPLGHLHVFTDGSLATAFEIAGFAPVAAWYFGMDIYELFMQLTMHVDEVARVAGKLISILQNAIDSRQLSDSMVLAGTPL